MTSYKNNTKNTLRVNSFYLFLSILQTQIIIYIKIAKYKEENLLAKMNSFLYYLLKYKGQVRFSNGTT